VADRTNLDLGFVSLVMSVNGRVRPADLQQIPQANRASVLQAYYQANSASTAMHFEGDVLVSGTGSAAQAVPQAVTPAPAPAPIAAARVGGRRLEHGAGGGCVVVANGGMDLLGHRRPRAGGGWIVAGAARISRPEPRWRPA